MAFFTPMGGEGHPKLVGLGLVSRFHRDGRRLGLREVNQPRRSVARNVVVTLPGYLTALTVTEPQAGADGVGRGVTPDGWVDRGSFR